MKFLPSSKPKPGELISARSRPNRALKQARDLFLLCIILDTSPSTLVNQSLEVIRECLGRIFETLKRKDPLLFAQIEVALLGYGTTTGTELYLPFTPLSDIEVLPELPEVPSTHVFESHCRAVAETLTRKTFAEGEEAREIRAAWIFDMSDFQVMEPDISNFRSAALEATVEASKHGISIFNWLAGDACNEQVAASLSQPGIPVTALELADFEETFADWVLKSLRSQSMSQFGELTVLPDYKGQSFRSGGGLIGD